MDQSALLGTRRQVARSGFLARVFALEHRKIRVFLGDHFFEKGNEAAVFGLGETRLHGLIVGHGHGGAPGDKGRARVGEGHAGGAAVAVACLPVKEARGFHLTKRPRGGGAVDADEARDVRRLGQPFVAKGQKHAPCGAGETQVFQPVIQAAFLRAGGN